MTDRAGIPARIDPIRVQAVDLGACVKLCQGYELRPREGGQGIAVLEHPGLRDRVAISRTPEGRWVYADVRHYAPRGASEPADRAFARLRECIGRSPSKGGLPELAQRIEGLKRDREALDLLVYLQRVYGYELRPRDGGEGVMVLDSVRLHDRVAVAQAPDGRWVIADVRHYVPRAVGESAERALGRLRDCIGRSPSREPVAQLVARANALERGTGIDPGAPQAAGRETQPMGGPGFGRQE
jgi:hypothetical protein